MKIFWTLEKQERQNLLVLFVVGLLFWSSVASLLPTLPSYVEDVGGTKQQVGIVMGAFAIGLLLFRPMLGQMADKRSRKLVLLLGTAVAGIAPLGYLFVQSIPLLMAVRAFHGISIAAFGTGYSALVVDLSPIRQRGELIGYMSLVVPIGVATGPAIGGLLQNAAGYKPLFVMATGLGILSLIGACQIKEYKRGEIEIQSNQTEGLSGNSHSEPLVKQIGRIFGSLPLGIPSLVLLLIGFAFGALTTFVPLFIRETRVDLNAGWFYTAAAIASFSMRLFIGRASDRYGRGLFIIGSLGSYVLAMLMLSQARSASAFLLAAILEGAGAGTLIPMMIALLSDRSSPQERGRVFALCISGFDLGVAIAAPLFGSVAEQVGYRGIFLISSGLAMLALIVFLTLSSKNLSSSVRFALGRERDAFAVI